jgi:hypothetical protein
MLVKDSDEKDLESHMYMCDTAMLSKAKDDKDSESHMCCTCA